MNDGHLVYVSDCARVRAHDDHGRAVTWPQPHASLERECMNPHGDDGGDDPLAHPVQYSHSDPSESSTHPCGGRRISNDQRLLMYNRTRVQIGF